ncbi:hypothetical protein PtB15_3B273 [Puccinia triticina]|nr:hypothetical protein PtB15_3B273 [Puccinia triticina]
MFKHAQCASIRDILKVSGLHNFRSYPTNTIRSEDLLGRLRSLKHRFFLSHGNSFTTSLDSASHELGKKLRYVNVSRLQNQFRLAIRNPRSWSSSDPYEEDVKVTMATTSLTDWLLRIVGATGLIGTNLGCTAAEVAGVESAVEALTPCNLTVRFPLSLVISRKTILHCQLFVRYLLHLKHLEQSLTTSWTDHIKSSLKVHPRLEY